MCMYSTVCQEDKDVLSDIAQLQAVPAAAPEIPITHRAESETQIKIPPNRTPFPSPPHLLRVCAFKNGVLPQCKIDLFVPDDAVICG